MLTTAANEKAEIETKVNISVKLRRENYTAVTIDTFIAKASDCANSTRQ